MLVRVFLEIYSMSLSKRDLNLIKKAEALMENAHEGVSTGNELHVFDFDETLAYPPDAAYTVYFGYYPYKQPFIYLDIQQSAEGMGLLKGLGIEPFDTEFETIDGYETMAMKFDHSGYEKMRRLITREWRQNILGDAFPKYEGGKWPKSVSIKYVFPEPEKLTPEEYHSLDGLDKMRAALSSGAEVYICTARSGSDQVKNVMDFLRSEHINLPANRIFAVGGEPKGLKVAELIKKHRPVSAHFYDDSSKNIASVKEECCDLVPSLVLVKYSRSEAGKIESIEKCGSLTERLKESKLNRNLFRRYRQLSGF